MGNIFCRSGIDEECDRLTRINLDDLNEYGVVTTTQPFNT